MGGEVGESKKVGAKDSAEWTSGERAVRQERTSAIDSNEACECDGVQRAVPMR